MLVRRKLLYLADNIFWLFPNHGESIARNWRNCRRWLGWWNTGRLFDNISQPRRIFLQKCLIVCGLEKERKEDRNNQRRRNKVSFHFQPQKHHQNHHHHHRHIIPYLFSSTCSHAGTGCANGWGRLRSLWQTNNPPAPCCPAL